ncbi:unnamed protein product [Prorocentrum cordatum]|uniref:Carboxypeptidase n=1 Tax=Prorocentrum cordatum TaxID=2364126 RepID=A0ABN9VDD8_9DINO|nr:unnamed protein product [Polarella glacialis]
METCGESRDFCLFMSVCPGAPLGPRGRRGVLRWPLRAGPVRRPARPPRARAARAARGGRRQRLHRPAHAGAHEASGGVRIRHDLGRQLLQATKLATEAHDLALAGSYVAAAKSRAAMEELVINASGLNPHDVRTTEGYDRINDLMQTFFDLNETKDMLHIPRESKFTSFSKEVHDALMSDIMRSQQHNVEKMLLAGIRVLLYQGQFDWKDGVVANEAWIRSMQWPGIAGYLQAERMIWRRAVDGNVAGYWRRFKNLEQVVVLGAGHMVPMNQPLSALDMIQRFVRQRQPAERPAAAASRGTVLV